MPRYAVVHALDDDCQPLGVVIEREDAVRVEALDEFALPRLIKEPYRVLQRDLSEVVYTPGDPGYFDQALIELSRVTSIGSRGTVPVASEASILRLFRELVLEPRFKTAAHGSYGSDGSEKRTYRGTMRQRRTVDADALGTPGSAPDEARFRIAA